MLVDCRDSHALIRLVKNSINGDYSNLFLTAQGRR